MHTQINNLSTKRVFTVEELSQYTGMKTSWIYKLTHHKKIPFSRPGGKLLFFDREKIEAWLLSNPSMTDEQNEIAAATYVTA